MAAASENLCPLRLLGGETRIRTGETIEHRRGLIVRNGGRLFGISISLYFVLSPFTGNQMTILVSLLPFGATVSPLLGDQMINGSNVSASYGFGNCRTSSDCIRSWF